MIIMKYDVIVIGGGIAGVTASIYLKRAMKNQARSIWHKEPILWDLAN